MAAAELTADEAGPSTHLDNFEDVSTNVSEFAQVVFHDVQECYTPGADLKCLYTLTCAIKPQSRDWIGVFKVGWTSTRQYRAFEWAPYPANWREGQEWQQEITFSSYYLPKDEDGEYYQLCYIDSTGKMRGASTPFQFLEQSADDFIQVIDDSMDILMIHNKSEYCVEELRRVEAEKRDIEAECGALKEKIMSLETELQGAKDQLNIITKKYELQLQNGQKMEGEMVTLSEALNEAKQKVVQLSEETTTYEKSLQQTEGALMEVVNREAELKNRLDALEKQHAQVVAERNNLKTQVDSAERNKVELCGEIDNLKQLLSHSNETHQEIRESEVRMKEQYQAIEHQLLVASAEKERYQILESKLASAEESRRLLAKEVDSMKMVQEKLSKDLVTTTSEMESLRVSKDRQQREFLEEKRKMNLEAHHYKEKQTLLLEQISALKDGIQQLAQEKEMASKGTKGSIEASHIATKDLKEKVKRAQYMCKEEVRRRGELQKKMVTQENNFREEKSNLMREVEELRLRLEMAAEEYKKVYTECRQLELRLEKRKAQKQGASDSSSSSASSTASTASSVLSASSSWKSDAKTSGSLIKKDKDKFQCSVTSTQTAEPVRSTQASQVVLEQSTLGIQVVTSQSSQATQAATSQTSQASQAAAASSQPGPPSEEKASQSGLPAVAVQMEGALARPPSRDDTFDLREMTQQMCDLARELDDRKKEVTKYQKMYQEEKENYLHKQQVWQLKYEALESKTKELQENMNKTLNDYTNVKHQYESLKFDKDSQQQRAADPEPAIRQTPVINGPGIPTMYKNPYADEKPLDMTIGMQYGNPYQSSGSNGAEAIPDRIMNMSVDSMNLDSLRYPPDRGDESSPTDAPAVDSVFLPEPLQPDVLPEAKIAAIKMVSSQIEGKPVENLLTQDPTDDEREDAQFVDAQEFPAGISPGDSPTATAPPMPIPMPTATPPTTPTEATPPPPPPLEPKKCPECVIEFPPTYPEEDFVKHVQRHFAKLCPVCQGLLDPKITHMDFQRHVESCLTGRDSEV